MTRARQFCARVALAATMALIGASAQATPSYGSVVNPPAVFFGSGNVNGNFTIETVGNLELALRAKDRATLASIDGSSGVYHANSGICNPTCSGGTKANWNYELSLNVRADGNTTSSLTDYVVRLFVDIDPTAATNFVLLNVFNNWPDNAYYNGAVHTGVAPSVGDYAVQQSANPLFGDSGFGFLPGQGLYDIRMDVLNASATQLLASVDIQVQVPEPASLALVGLGLLAAVGVRRRKLASKSIGNSLTDVGVPSAA